MREEKWVLCPICNNKTRIKVRHDTVLENFPLFCAKCKRETIINVIPIIENGMPLAITSSVIKILKGS